MADGDFYSKYSGEEIEKKLDGSVLFNEYQPLTDIQKQQARRNIGAGTVDSGLIIKGYYATYEELIAAQPNPDVSDAYGVGTEPPYNIFVWDSINKVWVNNGPITKGDKGDPGKDGEAPTAENIAAALGYTPAAADLSNVPDGAVTGVKITYGAVSRSKLAKDALYSPVQDGVNSRTLTVTDIGKTMKGGWNAAMTLTLTQSNSAQMPVGAEIAVFNYSQEAGHGTKIIGDGVRFFISGDNVVHTSATIKVAAPFGMIALKKFSNNKSLGDCWLVTGDVEVV